MLSQYFDNSPAVISNKSSVSDISLKLFCVSVLYCMSFITNMTFSHYSAFKWLKRGLESVGVCKYLLYVTNKTVTPHL